MCMVCWNVNWATSMAPIAGQNKCWCTGAPGLRAETKRVSVVDSAPVKLDYISHVTKMNIQYHTI